MILGYMGILEESGVGGRGEGEEEWGGGGGDKGTNVSNCYLINLITLKCLHDSTL